MSLVGLLAAPSGAVAIGPLDDNISGAVALAASPVNDSLNSSTDPDDVFSIDLDEGDRFVASLSGDSGTDFDLYLYAPGSTDISDPELMISDWSSYPDEIAYAVPTGGAGTYYVRVNAFLGSGNYTLTWSVTSGSLDDNIAGSTLPSSPFSGALDEATDTDDVFSVYLDDGDTFNASLVGDEGSDYDLYLYEPGSTDIFTDWIKVVDDATETSYPDGLSYVVPDGSAGIYYLQIHLYEVSGDYTLSWSIESANAAPVLGAIGDKSVNELSELSFTATATDADLPAQELTFSLGEGAPEGSSITTDGAFAWMPTEAQGPGTYEITIIVSDGVESDSETITVTVNEVALAVTPIAGTTRYDTAIEASKEAFPTGVTSTVDGHRNVIVATGRNWPDALGGASLAGALECPILLTDPGVLPGAVAAEIVRLKATRVVVLGGEGAVSDDVYQALDALDGVSVMRVAGTTRYQTSYEVAQETVRVLEAKGAGFAGTAFIATGRNFPDALGASPVAAAAGIPLYLVDPASGLTSELQAALERDGVTEAIALGGAAVVPEGALSDIGDAIGASTDRWAGEDRYDTARVVAAHGVSDYGLSWDLVAVATGGNFPDALAGGALQGADGSVMLLTPSSSLYPGVSSTLSANKATISEVRFLGGTGAISDAVRSAVTAALE